MDYAVQMSAAHVGGLDPAYGADTRPSLSSGIEKFYDSKDADPIGVQSVEFH